MFLKLQVRILAKPSSQILLKSVIIVYYYCLLLVYQKEIHDPVTAVQCITEFN